MMRAGMFAGMKGAALNMAAHRALPVGPDFRIDNHGSILILNALTPAAQEWVADHIPEDAMSWGAHGTVVEPRYMGDIVDGIINDGLEVA